MTEKGFWARCLRVGDWAQWIRGRCGRGNLREEGRFAAAWVAEEEDADCGLLVCFHWGWRGDAWFRILVAIPYVQSSTSWWGRSGKVALCLGVHGLARINHRDIPV